MRQRSWWACAVLAALGGATPAAERFNLVAVVTDDQARWAVGAYGNRECKTPNVDRLAREGARFLSAFVPTPVCSPSRASYLTGLYGSQVGIGDWIAPNESARGVGLAKGALTWPAVLRRAGYRTALVGKWHLGGRPEFHPTRRGFDHFMGALGGGFAPRDPVLEVGGKDTKLEGFSADVVTDEALRWLQASKGGPFALLIHYREPHLPYGPVRPEDAAHFKNLDPTIPAFRGLDARQVKGWYRDYYAAVHAVDRNLGRVLAKLEELKLDRQTIVTFTSDHGYMIGHHGLHAKGNGFWVAGGVRGPKRPNMFEESIRVPLLVRWPGTVKPGLEVKEPVSNLDTFASVLGMLGVRAPAGLKLQGADFSPLLRGKKVAWRDTVYGQYDLHNGGLAHMRMVRTPRWKLVRHLRANLMDELYDLEADPGETRNLYRAARHRKARGELHEKMVAWMKSIGDPLLADAKGPGGQE